MNLRQKFHKGITFGIEYSFVFDKCSTHSQLTSGLVEPFYYDMMDRLPRNKWKSFHVHNDQGALEINSPSFASLDQAKRFYDVMIDCKKRYPLVSRPTDNSVGGGGHIHVSFPKGYSRRKRTELFVKIVRLYAAHPYLAWIFNEWGDTQTAKNFNYIFWGKNHKPYFQTDYSGLNQVNGRLFDPHSYLRSKVSDVGYMDLPIRKHHVIRLDRYSRGKPHTIEFRAFDMKHSFKDVVDHVRFVNALVAYADRMICPAVGICEKKEYLSFRDVKKGKKRFRSLLRTLGLEEKNYRRFYENYEKRAIKEDWLT